MSEALAATLPSPDVIRFFKVLADETRVAVVRALALTDLRAGEVGAHLQLPQNVVSYHLKALRSAGIVRDRRSSADARDIYYHVDFERLRALYASAGQALHPAMAAPSPEGEEVLPRIERPLRILFLCTHNRARSQLAEGITRYLAGDQVDVHSAGDHPTELHPLTIELLQELGLDASRHAAKHLDQFVGQQFDYVITTCDAARGNCPTFPGDPRRIHWSFDDPSAVEGGVAAQRQAFRTASRELMTRIRLLLSLPHPVTGERLTLRRLSNREQGDA